MELYVDWPPPPATAPRPVASIPRKPPPIESRQIITSACFSSTWPAHHRRRPPQPVSSYYLINFRFCISSLSFLSATFRSADNLCVPYSDIRIVFLPSVGGLPNLFFLGKWGSTFCTKDGSMKEEDEIQSPPSLESGFSASPTSNGRITVADAAPPPSLQNAANLGLPNQLPKSGGGGRDDFWSEDATAVLVDAWGERYLELSRGNLKQKHWKEVADIVSSRDDYMKTPKTDVQCKNRIDTVKKKYKQEKAKIGANGSPSQWPFFEKMEQLIGPTAKSPGSSRVLSVTVGTPSLKTDKVPVGIPVGTRQVKQYQGLRTQKLKKGLRSRTMPFRKRGRPDSESSGSETEISPASADSFPPENRERKRVGIQKETKVKVTLNLAGAEAVWKGKNGAREKESNDAVRELTQMILKFGDTYEQGEKSKLQQLVELEKQRMKFMTELELQRMGFFLKTQLEISELRHGKKV